MPSNSKMAKFLLRILKQIFRIRSLVKFQIPALILVLIICLSTLLLQPIPNLRLRSRYKQTEKRTLAELSLIVQDQLTELQTNSQLCDGPTILCGHHDLSKDQVTHDCLYIIKRKLFAEYSLWTWMSDPSSDGVCGVVLRNESSFDPRRRCRMALPKTLEKCFQRPRKYLSTRSSNDPCLLAPGKRAKFDQYVLLRVISTNILLY